MLNKRCLDTEQIFIVLIQTNSLSLVCRICVTEFRTHATFKDSEKLSPFMLATADVIAALPVIKRSTTRAKSKILMMRDFFFKPSFSPLPA